MKYNQNIQKVFSYLEGLNQILPNISIMESNEKDEKGWISGDILKGEVIKKINDTSLGRYL